MRIPSFKTKKDIIVEILREAILSGDLKPGERLLQDELASKFNVSLTPVREALRQLEADGIVHYSPHKGVYVTEAKIEEVQEVYLIRRALEGLATQHAVPNLSKADIRKLRALQSQIEAFAAAEQIEKLRKANYQLHMLIYKKAEMPELFGMIRNMWAQYPWDSLYVLPVRIPEIVVEHRRLIDAIEDGNPELADKLMVEHIDNGASTVLTHLIDARNAAVEPVG